MRKNLGRIPRAGGHVTQTATLSFGIKAELRDANACRPAWDTPLWCLERQSLQRETTATHPLTHSPLTQLQGLGSTWDVGRRFFNLGEVLRAPHRPGEKEDPDDTTSTDSGPIATRPAAKSAPLPPQIFTFHRHARIYTAWAEARGKEEYQIPLTDWDNYISMTYLYIHIYAYMLRRPIY